MTLTKQQIDSIAAEYLAAPHTPFHESYAAFVAETIEQFNALLAADWQIELSDVEPYGESDAMFADMDGRYLRVFTGGDSFADTNPLAVRLYVPAMRREVRINEMFRAVHDVNGHGPTHEPFETPEGEVNAYLNHKRLYSPRAHGALFGETNGQLCHYLSGRGFVAVQECKVLGVRF